MRVNLAINLCSANGQKDGFLLFASTTNYSNNLYVTCTI